MSMSSADAFTLVVPAAAPAVAKRRTNSRGRVAREVVRVAEPGPPPSDSSQATDAGQHSLEVALVATSREEPLGSLGGIGFPNEDRPHQARRSERLASDRTKRYWAKRGVFHIRTAFDRQRAREYSQLGGLASGAARREKRSRTAAGPLGLAVSVLVAAGFSQARTARLLHLRRATVRTIIETRRAEVKCVDA